MGPPANYLIDYRCPRCNRPVRGVVEVACRRHLPKTEFCGYCHVRVELNTRQEGNYYYFADKFPKPAEPEEWLDAFRSDFISDDCAVCLRRLNRRRQGLFACACCRLLFLEFKKYNCVGKGSLPRALETFNLRLLDALQAVELCIDDGLSHDKAKQICGKASFCADILVANYLQQDAKSPHWATEFFAVDREVRLAIRAIRAAEMVATHPNPHVSDLHALDAALCLPYFSFHFLPGRLGHQEISYENQLAHQEWSVRKQNAVFNSFRAVPVDSPWRTPTTRALATACYRDREAFPVLLDALEETGADVREHRKIVFYKGNWLVDWLRGVQ